MSHTAFLSAQYKQQTDISLAKYESSQLPPPEQNTKDVSAHEHWQKSAHLYGHARQKDELGCGSCGTKGYIFRVGCSFYLSFFGTGSRKIGLWCCGQVSHMTDTAGCKLP